MAGSPANCLHGVDSTEANPDKRRDTRVAAARNSEAGTKVELRDAASKEQESTARLDRDRRCRHRDVQPIPAVRFAVTSGLFQRGG
jgi:hypothetical protein